MTCGLQSYEKTHTVDIIKLKEINNNININCPQCGLKSRFMPEEDDEKKKRILFNEDGSHAIKYNTCRCGYRYELNDETRTVIY